MPCVVWQTGSNPPITTRRYERMKPSAGSRPGASPGTARSEFVVPSLRAPDTSPSPLPAPRPEKPPSLGHPGTIGRALFRDGPEKNEVVVEWSGGRHTRARPPCDDTWGLCRPLVAGLGRGRPRPTPIRRGCGSGQACSAAPHDGMQRFCRHHGSLRRVLILAVERSRGQVALICVAFVFAGIWIRIIMWPALRLRPLYR